MYTCSILSLLMPYRLTAGYYNAKTNPTGEDIRKSAFKRALSLDNGISISWLEQTWNPTALQSKPISDADYILLKQLGFKSIRLPVAFEFYTAKQVPLAQVLKRIDGVLLQCKKHGFKLVIDYHYGDINDNNYAGATDKAIATWLQLTKHYLSVSADQLFFEIYNEPSHMDPQRWKDATYNIVSAIRKIDQRRTLLLGASNYNSIYELSRFVRLGDENIIYTFHFYEPFFFTHQGAEWVGDQVATTGVPFPYDGQKFPRLNPKAKNTWGETNYHQYQHDGNEQSVKDKLQIVKKWADQYHVPLLCSEYGVYNKYADADSRCRYIKAVRQTLAEMKIPGMLWDYNTNFSVFNGKPSLAHLPACMHAALNLRIVPNK